MVVDDHYQLHVARANEPYDGQVVRMSGGTAMVALHESGHGVLAGPSASRAVSKIPINKAREMVTMTDQSLPGRALGAFEGQLAHGAGFLNMRFSGDEPICCLGPGNILQVVSRRSSGASTMIPMFFIDVPYPPVVGDITKKMDDMFAAQLRAVCTLPSLHRRWAGKHVTRTEIAKASKSHVLFLGEEVAGHHHVEGLRHPIAVDRAKTRRIVGQPQLLDGTPQRAIIPVTILLKLTRDSVLKISSGDRSKLERGGRVRKLEID